MMAQGADGMKNGERLVLVGLFVQIIFFGFFFLASVVFHRRINRNPTGVSLSLANSAFSFKTSWIGLLYALYASSVAILIRSIFRTIEYIQGNSGYLLKNEIWLYLFDAVLMLAVMVIFNWVYPAAVLQERRPVRSREGYECEDNSTEMA
jgi:hypothetical protein